MPGHLCDRVVQVLQLCWSHVVPSASMEIPGSALGNSSHPSIQLSTLMAKHPEVLHTVRIYQTTDRNIVIIISLSYITSFTQHKNRSLTMITIFLIVNLRYIYCISKKYIFYFFYLRCCLYHVPQKIKHKQKPTGTDE